MKAAFLLIALLSTLASAQLNIVTFNSLSASTCTASSPCGLSTAIPATILTLLTNLGISANYALDFSAAGAGLYLNIDQNINVASLAVAGGNTVNVVTGITATTTNFTVAQTSNAFVAGTVAITGTGTFVIDSSSAVYVQASGQINAGATNVVASGQANVAGSITTTGSYAQNAGALVINSTSTASTAVVSASSVTIDGSASLNGNGNIGTASSTTTLQGSGAINIGNSPGTVTVNGDWRPSATSIFNLEVASTTSFDKLIVTGKAYIAGGLRVTLLNSYAPADNSRFSFVTAAGGTTGSFSTTVGTSTNTLTKWSSSVSANNAIANYNSAISVAVSGLVLVACVLASLL